MYSRLKHKTERGTHSKSMTMGKPKRSFMDRTVRFMGSLRECKSVSVDIPEFDSLEDIVEAMELCDTHDIPYEGLDDLDEFKERLELHFAKLTHPESRKTEVNNSCTHCTKARPFQVVLTPEFSLRRYSTSPY